MRTSAPSGSPCSHQKTECDRAGRERDVEQDRRSPVGQGLRPRGGSLGLLDEPHDAGERRLLAERRDADPETAASGDRAGHDLVAGLLGDRLRLARDQ